jgi:hypothetical protein
MAMPPPGLPPLPEEPLPAEAAAMEPIIIDTDKAGPPRLPAVVPPAQLAGDVLLNRLREIRAEIQDLETFFKSVQRGDFALKDYGPYLLKTVNEVTMQMVTTVDGQLADRIRRLNNLWEQITASPLINSPLSDFAPDEQQKHLTWLLSQCALMVNEIGHITIPARVNDWLRSARPGYYIPFHAVFQDEMPDEEARNNLLNYLAWAPLAVQGGLVDAPNGLIYRYAESAKERALSFLFLLMGLGIAAAAVIGAPFLPVDGWPLTDNDLSTLLIGWAAILVGVGFHLGIGLTKRAQSEGRPPIVAIDDLPLLLNAKAGQILIKVFMTLIGLFGLTFSAGIEEVTPLNAFLIGYALDSVVELFGTSVEKAANARVGKLKDSIG